MIVREEMLETYPIDGVVMIRDDNGGLCPCERCKAYVARSSTKSAAWEQYLILYRWFRTAKFAGDVAVYPYFDHYEPRLDPLFPADLLIVGHGSGAGMLARNYETLLPMGDTWLDNVLASFRVPTAARRAFLGEQPYTQMVVEPGDATVKEGESLLVRIKVHGRTGSQVTFQSRRMDEEPSPWRDENRTPITCGRVPPTRFTASTVERKSPP